MIVCFSCGFASPSGTGYCLQCKARLPKIDAETHLSWAGRIASRFEQIRDACDKVRSQAWSLEEFESYLANLFDLLESQKNAIIGYVRETGSFAYGASEVEAGMTGIERYEKGLELLSSFAQAGVPDSVLDQGLHLIGEGNEMMRRKLEEGWGEDEDGGGAPIGRTPPPDDRGPGHGEPFPP